MNLMDTALAIDAAAFAREKHEGQLRKYTGEKYFVHPLSVATTVSLCHYATEQMVAGALLHDVVEDCGVELLEVSSRFGGDVGRYVDELTKRDYLHAEWARPKRKAYEAGRLSGISAQGQTIKLADLIDNTRSMIWGDRDFAYLYLEEKQVLLNESLTRGDPLLLKIAREQVETGFQILDKWDESLTPAARAA